MPYASTSLSACDVYTNRLALVIGLSQEEYEVNEEERFVDVEVIFRYGLPGEFYPSVKLTMINGTATGNYVSTLTNKYAILPTK